MKTFVIIPAHNEESSIGRVIDNLKRGGYKNIIVVDDNSKDRTAEVAESKGVVVLDHLINRGQGASLVTGNEYALQNGADIVVHFDADGQMQVKDIPAMIEPIIKKEADITIGSRFLNNKSNTPFSKKITLLLGGMWLKTMYGVKLSDSQCGFRALSRRAVKRIEIKQDGMEHASEILIETFKKKIKHKEVPVSIKYTRYSKEHTHHGKFQFLSGVKIASNVMLKKMLKMVK